MSEAPRLKREATARNEDQGTPPSDQAPAVRRIDPQVQLAYLVLAAHYRRRREVSRDGR